MDFKKLISFLSRPSTPAAELRRELASLPREIELAEAAADNLEGERRALLLKASDEELKKHLAKVELANLRIERLFAARSELERRLADAEAAEEQLARRERYAETQELAAEARAALQRYPAAARQLVSILTTVARAEDAIAATNAALPADAAPIPSPEFEVRGLPADPREVLSEERLPACWYYTGAHASWGKVQPELVSNIESTDGRTGVLTTQLNSTRGDLRRFAVEKRAIEKRVRFLPERSSYTPTPLAGAIELPALRAGEAAIWGPTGPTGWSSGAMGRDADDVLRKAAELEDAASRPASDPRGSRQAETIVETIEPETDSEPATEAEADVA